MEDDVEDDFTKKKQQQTDSHWGKMKKKLKMRASNHMIGLMNLLTFLLSIPILVGRIWLSSRANNSDYLKFLQWPLIIIGVCIMVISLAGFTSACYQNTFLMCLYLFLMFFIITILIGFIIFAYAMTDKGLGRDVMNQAYQDYYLEDYSGWLEERVANDSYWGKIASCIRDLKTCSKMGRMVGGVLETANMFYLRKLSLIEVCINHFASKHNPCQQSHLPPSSSVSQQSTI